MNNENTTNEGAGSDSCAPSCSAFDALHTFANELSLRAEWHRNNQNDPHGYSTFAAPLLAELCETLVRSMKY